MSFEFLSFQQVENISVLQISFFPKNTFDYIPGSSAIKKELIEVTEINQSGSVNNILIKNNSEFYVFFSDGDILVGSKQNRVLNTSILIAPNVTIKIPVSCVEKGRWNFKSKKFDDEELFAPTKLRNAKTLHVHRNLEIKRGFYADQCLIWKEIDSIFLNEKIKSPSDDLGEIIKNKKDAFRPIINSFKIIDDANGAAFFLNDSFMNLDIYNRTDIYKEYFDKLCNSLAFEYNHKPKNEKIITEKSAKSKIKKMLDAPEIIESSKFNSVGVGEEERFKGKNFIGFNLIYNEHLIHKSIQGVNGKTESKPNDFDDFSRVIY